MQKSDPIQLRERHTGHAVHLAIGRDNPRVSELHVREYEPRDALRGLHGRALRETENACPAAGGEFLVGEHATAVDHHEGGAATGVLRRMRVDPAHQRRGYGHTMLETLESRARDPGYRPARPAPP